MRRLFPVTADSAAPDVFADREWALDELAEVYAYPQDREAAAGPDAQGVLRDQTDPPAWTTSPALGGAALARAAAAPNGAWLRGNMVSSLDGAAHHDGRSEPLSSSGDMRIFGVLRALADVIVVGAETVRQEGYGPAKAREAFAELRAARGQAPAAAMAVVSASLDLDFAHPLFTAAVTPTLLLTGAEAPADRVAAARAAGVEVVIAGKGHGVEPATVVRLLAERGLRRQLTEGGPRLLAQFAAVGALDEMCLTLAPVVTVGAAPRIMDGRGVEVPERFALASVLEESGFLFTRYRRI
ncbi:dihydrofolate reductase family protein [Streptomyces sp. URMC 123]|uniref:dihydrofolate reductase family protein n=1 Tax=Streptomyces sp. URMC 123 TaxID=3423403 RepID=UPI003F1C8B30